MRVDRAACEWTWEDVATSPASRVAPPVAVHATLTAFPSSTSDGDSSCWCRGLEGNIGLFSHLPTQPLQVLVLFGGRDSPKRVSTDTHVFACATSTWHKLVSPPWLLQHHSPSAADPLPPPKIGHRRLHPAVAEMAPRRLATEAAGSAARHGRVWRLRRQGHGRQQRAPAHPRRRQPRLLAHARVARRRSCPAPLAHPFDLGRPDTSPGQSTDPTRPFKQHQ